MLQPTNMIIYYFLHKNEQEDVSLEREVPMF